MMKSSMNVGAASLLIAGCFGSLTAGEEGGFDRWRGQVEPAQAVQVKDERLKLSPEKPAVWSKGTPLRQLQTLSPGRGVPANGAIDPQSVVVRSGDRVLVREKEYLADPVWGSLGIGPQPSVTSDEEVSVDYRYSLRRIDSVVRSGEGKESLVKGHSHLTTPQPPALQPGQVRLANIFIDYFQEGKTAQIFPVLEPADRTATLTTPGRIPRTLAKLKAGGPVKIVCWGDSVTVGGDASTPDLRYSALFERRLKAKFPAADIAVETIAVGGSNSLQWLYPDKFKHPSGQCDWQKIAQARPDLVTIEFVNDAGLGGNAELFKQTYDEIRSRLGGLNAEVLFITPHFTMPGMMGFQTLRDPEGRPYVLALRRYAREHGLALADASSRWEHLWKEGLPYTTLLMNGINHPDDRGHALFADELLKCFGQ